MNREQELVRRGRLFVAIAFFAGAVYGVIDLWAHGDIYAILGPLDWAHVALMGLFWWALGLPAIREKAVPVLVLATGVVYVSTALTAMLVDDIFMPLIAFLTIALLTATLLPWAPRAQLATVIIGALSLVSAVTTVEDGWAKAGYPGALVIATFVASVYITRELDRSRATIERQQTSLRDASEHYSQLVASVRAIVWRADAATLRFSFVSQEAEKILGYPAERWMA
ncbi:MAG: hypothetical protein ACREQY_15565, partial [Candidatus Binatia bacterium]